MKRPKLNKIDLNEVINSIVGGGHPIAFITLSPGQWDALLQASYDHGWTLLEIGRNEESVGASRKA